MNPIEIHSQQQLDEIRQKYGEAFFTMKKDSIEAIENFSDDQVEELFLLFKKLLSIFAIENSTTIKNSSDEFLLRFFIDMEMAKLFDKPTERYKTATLRNFLSICELNEIFAKHKDSIDKLTTYRGKVLAHTDLDAMDKIDPKPIIEYTGLLKEITVILFKVFCILQTQPRLCEHDMLEKLLSSDAALRKMLGKNIEFRVKE
jgi:hypothetical protein